MESRRMVYETVTPEVVQVKKDKEYRLIYAPDFVKEDDKIISSATVERIGQNNDRIQFNGFDREGRQYRHTSRQIPFDFKLSDGVLNKETYRITYKGKNPQEYISM